MAQQDTMKTTMATGNNKNEDVDGTTVDGAKGNDNDGDDCDKRR